MVLKDVTHDCDSETLTSSDTLYASRVRSLRFLPARKPPPHSAPPGPSLWGERQYSPTSLS